MSSTERSRAFRERNPGYHGRWKRDRQAAYAAVVEDQRAAAAVAPARVPLALPAPAEVEAFPDVFAQLKAAAEARARLELLLVPASAG